MGGARWRVVSPLGKMSDNNVRYRTFGCGLRPVSVYSSIDGRSGSTAVKCGRHQMSEIVGEIRGTPKNVIHR